MPAMLQYMLDHDDTTIPKIAQFANRVFNVEADPCNPKEVGQEGINRFRAWLKSLGMPATLSELTRREITDANIDELVDQVRYTPERHNGRLWPLHQRGYQKPLPVRQVVFIHSFIMNTSRAFCPACIHDISL